MSTNPFDDESNVVRSWSQSSTGGSVPTMSKSNTGNKRQHQRSSAALKEPAIWAARHVEWPLPETISLSNYQKLLQKQGQDVEDGYFSGLMRSVLPSSTSAKPDSTTSLPEGNHRPLANPKCVATANGWIVAALEEAKGPLRLVSRWNVRRSSSASGDSILCLPPPKSGTSLEMSQIKHVFMDPTGCHTALSARNGEFYYLHSSSKTIQKLPGFGPDSATTTGIAASAAASSENIQIGLTSHSYVTAIAWDRERGTEGSSQTILLGTNVGEIYEYSLEASKDTSLEPPTLLHRLSSPSIISGLYFERSQGLAILASTCGRTKPTRLYTFFSQDTSFRTVFTGESSQLVELPGSMDWTDLRLLGSQFALQTATGIYYGTLDPPTAIKDVGMLAYHDQNVPISMALTPHHFLLLSESNQIFFINRVTNQVIQHERVDWISSSSGSTGQLLMDIRRPDQVWLRQGRTLIHISSTMEDRDVWKFTLLKCLEQDVTSNDNTRDDSNKEDLLEHAKSLCTNSIQKAVVTHIRGEIHLDRGRTELAAKYLAQCPPQLASFEETCLRLALPSLLLGGQQMGDFKASFPSLSSAAAKSLTESDMALIGYLSDKMRSAKLNDDKVLSTMLGAWLTELHLHERSKNAGVKNNTLFAFLTNHVGQMDAHTILRILSSHDVSAVECADYAAASGNVETALQAALSKPSGVHDALRILYEAPLEVAEPYYYRHASLLLARAPLAAGKSFLSRYSQGLSPTKLLPSFMHYEKRRTEIRAMRELNSDDDEPPVNAMEHLRVSGTRSFQDLGSVGGGVEVHIENSHLQSAGSFVDDEMASVKYLEGVIRLGCRSSSIYSYLVSLYVAMDDEEPLLKFLRTHVPAAATAAEVTKRALLASTAMNHFDDGISSPLDMSYALRTILGTGRHFRSAIRLYMGFGLRQQAVELALKVDPTLARDLAREATAEDERKRLWLMIARNAAANRGKDVVSDVVEVLKDCGPDILSIEDVLPFLPDFAQIDQVKDEICDALTSYSAKIEGYLQEMNDCDQTCDTLREEITRMSTYRMQMKADATCALTGKMVLDAGEPFYVFPSGFAFLESALTKEVMPFLNEKQRHRVVDIQKELQHISSASTEKELERLQTELDGLIAADCPLTGAIMVDSIDQGFLDSEEASITPELDHGVVEMSSSSTSKVDQTYMSIQYSGSM